MSIVVMASSSPAPAGARASVCSWRSVAAFFSQAALSSMGNTPLYWPGLRIERVTTRRREMCTWSAMLRWPSDRRRRRRSCSARRCAALPAMPTQPAIAVCAPMRTLWPIWIRLSSLTPSSITVSSSAPRSMQVLAPISTSSPMRTRAELLDLFPAAVGAARSRSRRRRSRRRGARCSARRCGSPRRSVTRGAEPRAGADARSRGRRTHARRSTRRRRSRRRPRSPRTRRSRRRRRPRRRVDDGARMDAGAARRPRARRPPLRQPREVEVGVGGDDRRAARRGRVAQRRADDHAAGRADAASCAGSAGWRGRRSCAGVGRLQRADAVDARARRRRAVRRPSAATISPSVTAPRRHAPLTCRLRRSAP